MRLWRVYVREREGLAQTTKTLRYKSPLVEVLGLELMLRPGIRQETPALDREEREVRRTRGTWISRIARSELSGACVGELWMSRRQTHTTLEEGVLGQCPKEVRTANATLPARITHFPL